MLKSNFFGSKLAAMYYYSILTEKVPRATMPARIEALSGLQIRHGLRW
jgi:hypothetical protein